MVDPAEGLKIDDDFGGIAFTRDDLVTEKVNVNVIKKVSANEMPEYLSKLEKKKDEIIDHKRRKQGRDRREIDREVAKPVDDLFEER